MTPSFVPTRRHSGAALLGLLLAALACRPQPRPPLPGDTTTMFDSIPVDTVAADTVDRDTLDSQANDTVGEVTPADTLVSLRPMRITLASYATASGSFAFGISQTPTAMYCGGPFNAMMKGVTPKLLGGILRMAARCGQGWLVVVPRNLFTTNHETQGRYSASLAKAAADQYRQAFPADSFEKYVENGALLGMSWGDDFTNARVWGGSVVTCQTFTPVMQYVKQTLPAVVPMGARQQPAWIDDCPTLAQTIDFGWLQYLTARKDLKTFYSKGQAIADKYGFQTVRGVNVHSCHKSGGDDPCSASELRSFLGEAINPSGYHPACASLSWRYDDEDYKHSGVKEAYADLVQQAASQPAGSCHR